MAKRSGSYSVPFSFELLSFGDKVNTVCFSMGVIAMILFFDLFRQCGIFIYLLIFNSIQLCYNEPKCGYKK